MTLDDMLTLPGSSNPVLCKDGRVGILTLYPTPTDVTCGVQVDGEPEARMISCSDLFASPLGALRERGAPSLPTSRRNDSMLDSLLIVEWVDRDGPSITELK